MFLNDTFTDAAGTDLAAHTGELGATWTEHPSYTAGAVIVSDANRVRSNAAGDGCYLASGQPAGSSFDVEALVHIASDSHGGFVFCADDAANTMYVVRRSSSLGRWILDRLQAGSASNLDFVAAGVTAGQSYLVRVEKRGSSIKVFIDDVEQMSAVDSTLPTGQIGVRLATATTNTTGVHIDSLTATDVDSAQKIPTTGVG